MACYLAGDKPLPEPMLTNMNDATSSYNIRILSLNVLFLAPEKFKYLPLAYMHVITMA